VIEWLDSVTGLGQVASFLGYVVLALAVLVVAGCVLWWISARIATWTDFARAIGHWNRCPNGKNKGVADK